MYVFLRSISIVLALVLLVNASPADAPKAKPKPKPKSHTFHGMIVLINGTGGSATIDIKHQDGVIKTFTFDGKTKIGGLNITSMQGLKKGQMVKVQHIGKHADKVDVEKHAGAISLMRENCWIQACRRVA